MQLSLLAAAIWFWLAVLASGGTARWRALVALLVTSKLFCLLGVLLVFSPRLLYPMLTLGHHAGAPGSISGDLLADQHFAGLLMLVACPLTYLAAGVAIAAQWLRELSADGIDSPTLRPISLPA